MWNTTQEYEAWSSVVYAPFTFPASQHQETTIRNLFDNQKIICLHAKEPQDNSTTLAGCYRIRLTQDAEGEPSETVICMSHLGTKAWLSTEIQNVFMSSLAKNAKHHTIPEIKELPSGKQSEVFVIPNTTKVLVARTYPTISSRPLYAQEKDLTALGRAIGEWDVMLDNTKDGKGLIDDLSVFDEPSSEYKGADFILDYPEALNRATGEVPDAVFNAIRGCASVHIARTTKQRKLFETAAHNITMANVSIELNGHKIIFNRPDQVFAAPAKTTLGLAAAHIVTMAADSKQTMRRVPTAAYEKAFWLANGYNEVVPLNKRIDEHDLSNLAVRAICFTEIFGKMGNPAFVGSLPKNRRGTPPLRETCTKIAYVQKFYKAAFGG